MVSPLRGLAFNILVTYIIFEILDKDMKKVILTNNIKIRTTSQIITVVVKATHPTCSEIPGITVAVSTNLEGRLRGGFAYK